MLVMMMMIEAEERRRVRHDGQVLLYYARNTSPIDLARLREVYIYASGALGAKGQCLLVW
jgi:hypothetical protein